MKRVAKRYVIIHCPVDSSDKSFQGTSCDKSFQKWFHNRFKYAEPNTAEHLNSRLPTIEELSNAFPSATITGKQNAVVWMRNLKIAYTPYFKYIGRLMYKLRFQKHDDIAPYHACLLLWVKKN